MVRSVEALEMRLQFLGTRHDVCSGCLVLGFSVLSVCFTDGCLVFQRSVGQMRRFQNVKMLDAR
jgi:hypothetical protein